MTNFTNIISNYMSNIINVITNYIGEKILLRIKPGRNEIEDHEMC